MKTLNDIIKKALDEIKVESTNTIDRWIKDYVTKACETMAKSIMVEEEKNVRPGTRNWCVKCHKRITKKLQQNINKFLTK